ncbi:O-antigen ligase family protein [Bacteroidota bacterium]
MAEVLQKLKSKWVYLAGGLFAVINALLIANEFYYAPLLPVALAILLLAFFALDKLVLLIVFFTPLSVNFSNIGLGVGLAIPTDPLLFGVMLFFLLKVLAERKFTKQVADHPITLAITVNIVWIGITTITSEMPIVSLKFLISRLWFVITFYYLTSQLFKDFNNIKRFIGVYIAGFVIVIIYTIVHHSMYSFGKQPAHWVMEPFFIDHTSYGAALAMFYPLLTGLVFSGKYRGGWKILLAGLFVLFSIALVLSYTRAAWVSLVGALAVYIVMWLRIKFSTVLVLAGTFALGLFLSWDSIVLELEKNRQDSSGDIAKHIQSISNISTDASNLERLNRWSSALRMFEARPYVGWGPGTYMFQYAPFQLSGEKTEISTNAGDMGNAHSEYIGPLAESGVFGLGSFLIVLFCVIYYGIKLYPRIENREHRLIMINLLLGLITYMIHGMLNNFLDTDKASAPFWGFIAAIVAIDVYHTKNKKEKESDQQELLESDSE